MRISPALIKVAQEEGEYPGCVTVLGHLMCPLADPGVTPVGRQARRRPVDDDVCPGEGGQVGIAVRLGLIERFHLADYLPGEHGGLLDPGATPAMYPDEDVGDAFRDDYGLIQEEPQVLPG